MLTIITRCSICGSPIHQYSRVGHGYCKSCKNSILKRWSAVKFEDRVKYLRKEGHKI